MKRYLLGSAVLWLSVSAHQAAAFGTAIPVSDRNLDNTVAVGLSSVTDNITNLGTQVDRTVSANTDEIIAQLKGMPLTAKKYDSAQQFEVAPIVRGRCVFIRNTGNERVREKAVNQRTRAAVERGRRIRDQRDAPAEAARVAAEIAVELAVRSSDPETAKGDPTMFTGFGEELNGTELNLLAAKWDFMMMPVKESLPSTLRSGDEEASPEESVVYAAVQARNERMEVGYHVGQTILARQGTTVPFDTVKDLFPGVEAPESGRVSVEEVQRQKAHWRFQSPDWLKCIETDCEERAMLEEMALMTAHQLELSHRIATAMDKQNMLLSLILASSEEARLVAIKQNNNFDAGQ